jgi:cob(I)alamin adenosyltransferase
VRIYTRTGDAGMSSLFDGGRYKKSDLRFEVYGELDFLNVMIGDAKTYLEGKPSEPFLAEIQKLIFSLSSILATEDLSNLPDKVKEIDWEDFTKKLECNMDHYDEQLPELKTFILPGGARGALMLHYCRVQTRKCERLLVGLSEKVEIDAEILKFVNRLSDFFFMAARSANYKNGIEEAGW